MSIYAQGTRLGSANKRDQGCGRPLRGALRSSTNIYYAQQASAIYLPRAGHAADPDLVDLVTTAAHFAGPADIWGLPLLQRSLEGVPKCVKLVEAYSDEEINEASRHSGRRGSPLDENEEEALGDDAHTAFRRREFDALLQKRGDDQLVVSPVPPE